MKSLQTQRAQTIDRALTRIIKLMAAALWCCLFFALPSAFPAIYGAAAQTFYDEGSFERELTFSSLTDYATDGENFAFADGGALILYVPQDGGQVSRPLEEDAVVRTEYDGGNLYLQCGGESYLFDGGLVPCDYAFTEETVVKAGDYYYFLDGDELCALQSSVTRLGSGFSLLKACSSAVYAVKDGTVTLITGTEVFPLSFPYTDFSAADTVAVGDTAEQLLHGYAGKTVTVGAGAYCTEVDLSLLDGAYFTALGTFRLAEPLYGLQLCATGNASIVAASDGETVKTYLVATPAEDAFDDCPSSESAFSAATVVADAAVYACPYACPATLLAEIAEGTRVTVGGVYDWNGRAFYRAVTEDGCEGYIAADALAALPTEQAASTDGGERLQTVNAQTLTAVLVIGALSLAAIVYLAVAGARSGRQPSARKRTPRHGGEEAYRKRRERDDGGG